jgi:hypothetical protein
MMSHEMNRNRNESTGGPMRIRVMSFLGVLGVLLLAAWIARADSLLAEVNIPFQFVIGEKTLPAGDYTLTVVGPTRRIIELRRMDGTEAVFSLVNDEQPNGNPGYKFVFDKYGSDRYFLEKITLGRSNGFELPKSKLEREMVAQGATQTTTELAALMR